MADNMNDDMIMDLDLNQEPVVDLQPPPPPLPPPFAYAPLLNDLETTHGRIEDRLRQLEAVSARARQRQRWRQIPLQGVNSVLPGSDTNPSLLHGSEAGGSRRHRSRQFSRVISESAASLSSISSALINAERLVEDLETYISDSLLRRTDAQILPRNQEMDTFFGETVEIQPEPQNAEMSPSLPLSTSSQRSVVTTVVQVDNLSTDSAVEIDLTISQSHLSSNTTRTNVSRALSLEGGTSRELRRRRLR